MGWSQRTCGLTRYQPANAYRGYTLFSANGGDDAYLASALDAQWVEGRRRKVYHFAFDGRDVPAGGQ